MNRGYRRRRSRLFFPGIVCVLLFGCGSALRANTDTDGAMQTVRLGREFKLRVGQQAALRGTKLRIKFAAVNDGRCPSDAVCVWAGNAAVRLQVSLRGGSEDMTLNTGGGPAFVGEKEYQGFKIKMVALNPYPRSDLKITLRDRIVTLVVSKE